MPEGPTIHRLARDHHKLFAGKTLRVSSPQGRFAEGAALLDGLRLNRTDAFGKNLFYLWTRGRILHVHLGMAGRFRVHKGDPPPPGEAVRMRLRTGAHSADLSGPMRCQLVSAGEKEAITKRLGPDPIRRDADPERAWEMMQKSKRLVGMLLIDQAVFAGVGNIYRSEVLFIEGVHPNRRACDVRRHEFDAIWTHLVNLMRLGVRVGRIVTVGAFDKGAERRFYVYKSETCMRCGGSIEWFRMANRGVYACPSCQG